MIEHPLIQAIEEGIEDLRSGRELRQTTVVMQTSPENRYSRYRRAHHRLAVVAWLVIAIGWMPGELLVHSQSGVQSVVGGMLTVLGLAGGIVLLIVGNMVLSPRCRS